MDLFIFGTLKRNVKLQIQFFFLSRLSSMNEIL